MSTKNKVNFRQNSYNTSDSGIMFLLALVVPQFLMILIMLICTSATGLPFSSADPTVDSFATTYPTVCMVLLAVVPQISLIGSFFFISEYKKVNYAKANQINFKKFNWLVMLIVLAIGAVCLLGFTPFVNWFDHMVEGLGYSSSVSNLDVSTVGKFIASIFYIGLLPAICEELVFRGVISNGLKQNGTKVAVVLSAVLFALMHQNLQQFVYQLFLGGVMAYIVLKTGNILYTMLLHFLNNFIILLDAFITSQKAVTPPDLNSYYSSAWNNIWPFLVMILAVGATIGLLFLLNFVLKKQKQKQLLKQQINISAQNDTNKNDSGASQEILDSQTSQDVKKQSFLTPLKNPFMIISLVLGVILWIVSVISSFMV